MSYDLDHVEKECPCPCGKGRIVYGSGTNDWNQIREGMTEILCLECDRKYKIVNDGLLPKDFPDYKGDAEAGKKMSRLTSIISNYRGSLGVRYWDEELKNKRKHLYLTAEEIKADEDSKYKDNWYMAIGFSKKLADKYTLEELKDAQKQISTCKASTQLNGVAQEIAIHHKHYYKSIKLSNVIVPVNMAVRNYQHYKDADWEDEEYISSLEEELKKAEAIYYKDYAEYEENRKKHLITYKLQAVKR